MFTRRRGGTTLVMALLVAATALLPAAAASAAAASAFPVKVHAADGTVTVPARPTAIVSLSPTATEMLYAIGAGSQVKAVDSYSDYPPNAPRHRARRQRSQRGGDRAYKPDLVVASGDPRPGQANSSRARDPGPERPGRRQPRPGVRGVRGARAGDRPPGPGRARRSPGSGPDRCHRQIGTLLNKPLTYYYELDQTYYSATSSTFIGQVLGLLGLHSIADSAKGAASSGGYPQLSVSSSSRPTPSTSSCRHDLLRPVARDGRRRARAGPTLPPSRTAGSRAQRRHRVAVGTADRPPALRSGSRAQAAPGVVT